MRKKAHGTAGAVELTSAGTTRRDPLAKKKPRGPQTEQPITRLSLPMRKILTYYRPLTAPPTLEEPSSTKGTRGRTLDFVACGVVMWLALSGPGAS